MPIDDSALASELRIVIGALVRRLRAEHRFSLSQASVLGRLDREGSSCVSDLAAAERVRPQSMAQTVSELEICGLVARRPDPSDGRRALVELTDQGRETIYADRRQREGWLAEAIAADLSPAEQETLSHTIKLLRRLVDYPA